MSSIEVVTSTPLRPCASSRSRSARSTIQRAPISRAVPSTVESISWASSRSVDSSRASSISARPRPQRAIPGRSPIRVAISTALPRCRSASSMRPIVWASRPEHPVDRAVAAGGPGHDDHQALVGEQLLVHAGGAVGVADQGDRLPHQAHRREPVGVLGQGAEVVAREALELELRELVVAGAGRQADHRRAPGRDAREALGEVPGRGQQLGGAALHAADLGHLDAVVLLRERLLGAVARPPRLLGQPLGLLDLAVEQHPHPAQRVGVPGVLGHPQLLGEPRVGRQLPVDRGDVAELQVAPQPVGVAAEDRLAVAGGRAQLEHLVGDRQPLARRVRARSG